MDNPANESTRENRRVSISKEAELIGDEDMSTLTDNNIPCAKNYMCMWSLSENGTGVDESIKSLILDAFKINFDEQPHSIEADRIGLERGYFMIQNADIVVAMKAKREELESSPGVEITYFENWAKTRCGLFFYACPKKVSDVKHLVSICRERNIKVGCGGSYHSWGPLYPDFCTKDHFGLLINTRDLELEHTRKQEIWLSQPIQFDEENLCVTIAPGVTTGELIRLFNNKRVGFKTNVVARHLTYGGLLATGSHGTGRDKPIMSDSIVSMKLVGADGEVHEYPKDFNLPEKISVEDGMNALRVHLGLFGVVVEITLKVERMDDKAAVVQNSYPKIGELFYGSQPSIQEIVKNHWSVQILWIPFNSLDTKSAILQALPHVNLWLPNSDEVWLRTVDLTNEYHEPNEWDQIETKIEERIQGLFAGEFGSPISAQYSILMPAYLSEGFKILKQANCADKVEEQSITNALHFKYGLRYAPAHHMEFAFPINLHKKDGFNKFLEAFKYVVEEIGDASKRVSVSVDMRFIKKSDCLLCPAVARPELEPEKQYTHTAYLEIVSFIGYPNYKPFFKKIGKKWMELGGVPHWAKEWEFLKDDGIYDHIRKFYGENIKTFTDVATSVNPENKDIFINSTMQELLFRQ